MLIRNAELHCAACTDIRVEGDSVAAIGPALPARPGEAVFDAGGAAVLPGLHDHHLHFMAFAASLDSLHCGPPRIDDAAALAQALRECAAPLRGTARWLRGIGYHESVAGAIDRHWLDAVVPDVPVRIQQRTGRLWILNSCALRLLGDLRDAPLERSGDELTGRLYDADAWLRARIGRQLPDVRRASLQLAAYGITGFTDTTPANDRAALADFARLQRDGAIVQRVVLMGDASLDGCAGSGLLQVGPTKIHLHDSALPDFDALCATVRRSHAAGRPVAVHCVTLTELVFALGVFDEAGSVDGDRIEHAAIAPPELAERIARLRLAVVTQPNFIAERGDAYLRDVDAADRPWLYRLRGLLDAGALLAGGSDAPFGAADPWAAMHAATTRRTARGAVVGAAEALSAQRALRLFLGDPLRPGGAGAIAVGAAADLCVLDRGWAAARADLAAVRVRLTLRGGATIWQAPGAVPAGAPLR